MVEHFVKRKTHNTVCVHYNTKPDGGTARGDHNDDVASWSTSGQPTGLGAIKETLHMGINQMRDSCHAYSRKLILVRTFS